MMINKIKKVSKRKIVLAIIILMFIGGIAAYYSSTKNSERPSGGSDEQTNINYGPPTKEELEAVNETKDKIIEEDKNRESNTWPGGEQKRLVQPIISGADQVGNKIEITSYVQNSIDEGQCTATLTKGSHKIQRIVASTRENSTSYCRLIALDVTEFPEKGNWSITIKYTSTSSEGESDTKNFEVK